METGLLLETPGVWWSHLTGACYWTLVPGKWMFTWQPSLHTATYQLRTGRQAPGMAFKRDSLKALCKVQILGKFRDSILDMTMHLYKINEMHWSQLPHFLQVIAIRNRGFPTKLMCVGSHCRKHRALSFSDLHITVWRRFRASSFPAEWTGWSWNGCQDWWGCASLLFLQSSRPSLSELFALLGGGKPC